MPRARRVHAGAEDRRGERGGECGLRVAARPGKGAGHSGSPWSIDSNQEGRAPMPDADTAFSDSDRVSGSAARALRGYGEGEGRGDMALTDAQNPSGRRRRAAQRTPRRRGTFGLMAAVRTLALLVAVPVLLVACGGSDSHAARDVLSVAEALKHRGSGAVYVRG